MRKVISILLTILLLASMVPAIALPLSADGDIGTPYVDANGKGYIATGCTQLNRSSTSLDAGWYVVSNDLVCNDRITVNGDVNIIICDGVLFSPHLGITVEENSSLTIWAQSLKEETEGNIMCGFDLYLLDIDAPGIGNLDPNKDCGKIVFNGTTAMVCGSMSVPIGIGDISGNATSGELLVNNGSITVAPFYTDGDIDNGNGISIQQMTVSGGSILAHGYECDIKTGGDLVINGGHVHAEEHGLHIGNKLILNGGRFSSNGIEGRDKVYAENGIEIGSAVEIYYPVGGKLSTDKTTILEDSEAAANVHINYKPSLINYAITLTGEIGVDFDLQLPKDIISYYSESFDSYMEFKIRDKTFAIVSFDQAKSRDDGLYRFTCNISSIQMAEDITPVFHYGDGKVIELASRSATDYIDYVVGHANDPDSEYASVENLVRKMADYGHYAQIRLSRLREWTIGEAYDEISGYTSSYSSSDISTVRAAVNDFGITKTFENSVIDKITYSMDFQSKPLIYLYIDTAGNEITGFSASETTKEGESTLSYEIRPDGRYRITVEAGMIHEIGKQHTVTVKSGDAVIATVSVSGLSYVKSALEYAEAHITESDPERAECLEEIDFMVAFNNFYSAAKAYVEN